MVAGVLPYLARQGVDPEDLTLLVYGGGGGIHGPPLAAELWHQSRACAHKPFNILRIRRACL